MVAPSPWCPPLFEENAFHEVDESEVDARHLGGKVPTGGRGVGMMGAGGRHNPAITSARLLLRV